jgi:hypothetical protein
MAIGRVRLEPSRVVFLAEQSARKLSGVLERRKALLLFFFTVVYFVGAILKARGKPLWFDEVLTTTIAELPRLSSIWTALSEGVQVDPPLNYLFVRAARTAIGSEEVVTRLPAMIGFWVFCLCLFRFTLRRTGTYYALSTMLIPFVTPAYRYAVETRPYGPLLGFFGVALVCWQAAADGIWRRLTVPVLGISLTAALLTNYYAILLYVPFVGAETFRVIRRWKVDWAVSIAMAVALVALPLCLPLIQGARQFSGHYWARPHAGDFVSFYEIVFSHTLLPLVLLLGAVIVYVVLPNQDGESGAAHLTAPGHEIVAGLLLLFLPAPALAIAFTVTNAFTERYVLPAVAGFVVVTAFAACGIARGRAVPGAFVLLVSVVCFVGGVTHIGRFQNPFDNEPLLIKTLEREAVAVSDGLLFLQLWHYAPGPLKGRLFYVASPELAAAYTDADTIDKSLLVFRDWANIQVVEYGKFATAGKEILIYQDTGRIGWLVPKLLHDGAAVRLEEWTRNRALLHVRVR